MVKGDVIEAHGKTASMQKEHSFCDAVKLDIDRCCDLVTSTFHMRKWGMSILLFCT